MIQLDTPTLIVPLHTDEHGVIRVSGTRVTLQTILGYYKQGETAEELHEVFPTIPYADILAVISYYLQHREVVDEYIQEQQARSHQIREQWEAEHPDTTGFYDRMRRIRDAKQAETT